CQCVDAEGDGHADGCGDEEDEPVLRRCLGDGRDGDEEGDKSSHCYCEGHVFHSPGTFTDVCSKQGVEGKGDGGACSKDETENVKTPTEASDEGDPTKCDEGEHSLSDGARRNECDQAGPEELD